MPPSETQLGFSPLFKLQIMIILFTTSVNFPCMKLYENKQLVGLTKITNFDQII